MRIKKYMKIPRDQYLKQIPFVKQIDPIKMSSDDLDYMENLAREGKDSELEDFINKKTLDVELNAPNLAAGMHTRNFMNQALGQLILKRNPEFLSMSNKKLTENLRDKVYPKIVEANKKHGYTTPNKIGYVPEFQREHVIASFNTKTGEIKIPEEQSDIKNIDLEKKATDIANILHELGHNVDDLIKYESDWKSGYGVLKNPKFEKVLKVENKDTTPQELSKIKSPAKLAEVLSDLNIRDIPYGSPEGREKLQTYSHISRTPNFEDYNWKKGDFDSDIVETPVSKYEEVGGEHHIGRPFSLENFKNLSKGGLEDIVKNTDKFKDLIKKLS